MKTLSSRQGRSQDFPKGGHVQCVKVRVLNQIVMSVSPPVVSCLHKKANKRRVTGTQDSLATPLPGLYSFI